MENIIFYVMIVVTVIGLSLSLMNLINKEQFGDLYLYSGMVMLIISGSYFGLTFLL